MSHLTLTQMLKKIANLMVPETLHLTLQQKKRWVHFSVSASNTQYSSS